MKPKFISITCSSDSEGVEVLFALDTDGCVWRRQLANDMIYDWILEPAREPEVEDVE